MMNEVINRDRVSSSKRAQPERNPARSFGNTHEARKIPRRSERTYAPLSFAQQRLWLFNQIEPDSSIYNVHSALHLDGKLNLAALQRTLSEIVRRHEVLRTRFVTIDGEPRQHVLETAELKLEVTDLSGLTGDEREAAVREATTAESREPFDLVHGPLLRVKLLRLGEEEHVVLL